MKKASVYIIQTFAWTQGAEANLPHALLQKGTSPYTCFLCRCNGFIFSIWWGNN